MNWEPISLESLNGIVTNDLADATPKERKLFARTVVRRTKWQSSAWGDLGDGFWVPVVMDQFARRIVGFGIQRGIVDGAALCWMYPGGKRVSLIQIFLLYDGAVRCATVAMANQETSGTSPIYQVMPAAIGLNSTSSRTD
jgi:hypothetical protein